MAGWTKSLQNPKLLMDPKLKLSRACRVRTRTLAGSPFHSLVTALVGVALTMALTMATAAGQGTPRRLE